MITRDKVTGIFFIIDEFMIHLNETNAEKLLLSSENRPHRRRASALSDSEIMTIMLVFHFGSFRNFKHYYLFFIKGTRTRIFPTRYLTTASLNWRAGYSVGYSLLRSFTGWGAV
ncbi:hypothetical protein LO761_11690 [Bacteroidaceae bacterium 14-104]|uniref:hypothetical protein n=1 Tax=Phocaeicola oris TaxID=2896850 RepID=UPI00234EB1A9|nr:hypothetical protein [Phocaeicola oris]MCE2617551.1 hypothetical protein [Phocaeicola oris]